MSHPSPPAGTDDLLLPLHRRNVLVTGGSRGIGAATVRALYRDGATVIFSYGSNQQAARAVAESLSERVYTVHADLAVAAGPGHQLIEYAQPPAGVYAEASGHQKIITCRHKPG